jgi:hypothetical protein
MIAITESVITFSENKYYTYIYVYIVMFHMPFSVCLRLILAWIREGCEIVL